MKKIRLAINGFGRIGRNFLRLSFGHPNLEFSAINDLGDIKNLAYLLKYDTVYGRYSRKIEVSDGFLEIDGQKIKFLSEKDPTNLPWKEMEVDVVVESTGVFESFEKSQVHIQAGAKRVVLSSPAKDADGALGQTVLMGINEENLKTCQISSNGSCTTNSLHPIAQVLCEKIGILKGALNTIHAYTATQRLVDGPDKDWRRGRAGAQNIIPSTTGAAVSVARVVKDLDGKFDGIAVRVPAITGSLADFTFLAKRKTSVEEVNQILKESSADPRWHGLFKTIEEPIVSSDIIGEPFAAIADLSSTKVIDGDLVKVLSWYDNEWGYSASLLTHVLSVSALI